MQGRHRLHPAKRGLGRQVDQVQVAHLGTQKMDL
jgi:hypothetical protein